MVNFEPTKEQERALETALLGNSFKIVAYAGAGKTSTLRLISERRKGRGLYLAFNKSIAQEAQSKFGPNVRCQTFHSLAFRHAPRALTGKIALPKQSPAQVAKELNLSSIELTRFVGGRKKSVFLSQANVGGIIGESLSAFCKTNAKEPAARHLCLPDWLDDEQSAYLRRRLYPALLARWEQSIDPRHQAGIGHEVYLKYWALSDPIVPADFVLFDEAQDADPLMMGALMRQSCQTIYVGDAHQQIYEWRGAVNAMKRLPYEQTLLTLSFRFGKAVADVANAILKALQETVPLQGNAQRRSRVSYEPVAKKDAVLCRTNAAAMNRLMQGLREGHKVYLHADGPRILRFCQGAENLKAGKKATAAPELSFFDNWAQAQEFAESGEGGEIKTWVKLIDEYGVKAISDALNRVSPMSSAQYVISTAHKAKGLEWKSVQIADDFLYDVDSMAVKISPEELRLLYVACTRAQDLLDVHRIDDLLFALKHKKTLYA